MRSRINTDKLTARIPTIAMAFIVAVIVGCGSSSTTPVPSNLPTTTSNPGFGATGKIRFGFGNGNDATAAVAIQSDGKIVMAGGSAPLISEHDVGAVVRLNQDGTLDISFGERGKTPVPLDTVSAMVIDSSGRIVIAGSAQSLTGFDPDFAAVRLNSNGTLDTSFGNGGKTVIPIGPGFYDVASSLVLQTDGKIVLAGQGTVGTVGGFVAARLNSDGTVDSGFGDTGRAAVAVNGSGASGVAIDTSGRIVMSGSALVGSYWDFAFVRLNSNGTPDTGFGTGSNGIVTIPVSGGSGQANAVTIDSSGRIVAAGNAITTTWDFAAIRLNDNGAIDSSFGNGGISIVSGWGISMFNTLAIDGSGKIMLAGTQNLNSTYSGSMPILVRLNDDGTPDAGFGSGYGIGESALSQVASGYNAVEITAVAFDGTGRPVVAGHDGWKSDFAAWRLHYDGTPDTSFGTGGQALVDVGNEQSQARALTLLADGKFLVAGFAAESGRFAIAKLNADGTFDPSFGTYGKTAFSLGTLKASAYGMKVMTNGQILLVGQSGSGLSGAFGVARVNSDGTIDSSFGSSGYSIISIGGYDRAYAVAVDSNGGIIVAGSTTFSGNLCSCGTNIAVARLGANGMLDTSFGTGGKVIIPMPMLGDDFGANSMTIDATGKIIVVGKSNSDFGIARLNSDGTFDTGFGNNGLMAITVSGGSAYAKTVQFDANGNLIIAGVTGESNGTLAVVRLKPDYTMDASFGSNGIAKLAYGGTWYKDYVNALAVDPLGRIVVAGSASPVCCDGDFAVARMLSNGVLDTAFGTNGIITTPVGENNDVVHAMALQPDGKIVLAGNGSYSFGLVRIDGGP